MQNWHLWLILRGTERDKIRESLESREQIKEGKLKIKMEGEKGCNTRLSRVNFFWDKSPKQGKRSQN